MMNPSDKSSRAALIVDDEEQLLRLMVRLLEGAGIRVWAAKDGVEARQLFREHAAEIDLALIDVIHPPDAGAADLLPELLTERPDLDVILTSGDVLPEILEERLASVGGRFLRKPFSPKALLRLLERDDKASNVTNTGETANAETTQTDWTANTGSTGNADNTDNTDTTDRAESPPPRSPHPPTSGVA